MIKDAAGQITELLCTYDPESKTGGATAGRKVKGTSHWVSAEYAVPAEVRLYDTLFINENPEDVPEGQTFLDNLNPNSLEVLSGALVEPSLKEAKTGDRFQFLRQGYFVVDPDSSAEKLVFNRIVSLKDTWAKQQKKN